MYCCLFFFFNDTATTEIYTLSLHDALPISDGGQRGRDPGGEGVDREDRDVRRGLCRRRTDQWVERLEELVGGGDERDSAHAQPDGSRAPMGRQGHQVAWLHLQGGGELLGVDVLSRPGGAAEGPGRTGVRTVGPQ